MKNIFSSALQKKFLVPGFFLFVILIGFFTYDDFGITWDEEISRNDNGRVVYDFMTTGAKNELLNGNEKYHGPAFELFLFVIEKKFGIRDSQSVYYMRHFVTYLVFVLALYFFYRFVSGTFSNWKWGILAATVLLLTPRLFPEAFYNSKDHAFLSFYLIAAYFSWRFIKKTSFLNGALLAFFLAIAIDIRILGIILALFVPAFLLMEYFIRRAKGMEVKHKILQVLSFIVLTCGFVILFWPVLWIDPAHHFIAAFKEMSLYHWNGEILFMGNIYLADQLPWYYLPVWILISVPPVFLVLFLAGLVILLPRFKKPFDFFIRQPALIISLFSVFVPIASIILLDSIVYDAWRHVFFIYPFMVMIMMYGLKGLFEKYLLSSKYKNWMVATTFLLLAGPPAFSMITLHPYQNLYFNILAGTDGNSIKSSYEMDYWGSSAREGLEYVCRSDTSKLITVFPGTHPVRISRGMLDEKDRGRIVFCEDSSAAKYFIGHYRMFRKPDYDFGKKIFSREIDDAPVLAVIKLKEKEKEVVRTYFQDFESVSHHNLICPPSPPPSGKIANYIGPGAPFSYMVQLINDSLISGPGLVADILLAKFELTDHNESYFITSINRKNEAPYFYYSERLRDMSTTGFRKWEWRRFRVPFPKEVRPADDIRMYVISKNGAELLIDDYSVEILKSKH